MTEGLSYKEKIAQDARLIILRELTRQIDGRLNAVSLRHVLSAHGIARTPDWVETQLNALEGIDAVELLRAGGMLIACITSDGRDHVGELAVLAGVTRPVDLR